MAARILSLARVTAGSNASNSSAAALPSRLASLSRCAGCSSAPSLLCSSHSAPPAGEPVAGGSRGRAPSAAGLLGTAEGAVPKPPGLPARGAAGRRPAPPDLAPAAGGDVPASAALPAVLRRLGSCCSGCCVADAATTAAEPDGRPRLAGTRSEASAPALGGRSGRFFGCGCGCCSPASVSWLSEGGGAAALRVCPRLFDTGGPAGVPAGLFRGRPGPRFSATPCLPAARVPCLPAAAAAACGEASAAEGRGAASAVTEPGP